MGGLLIGRCLGAMEIVKELFDPLLQRKQNQYWFERRKFISIGKHQISFPFFVIETRSWWQEEEQDLFVCDRMAQPTFPWIITMLVWANSDSKQLVIRLPLFDILFLLTIRRLYIDIYIKQRWLKYFLNTIFWYRVKIDLSSTCSTYSNYSWTTLADQIWMIWRYDNLNIVLLINAMKRKQM